MKIIEALKEVKLLREKCMDLSFKINNNSAHRDDAKTEYEDPKSQIQSWQTQIHQATARMEELLLRISYTNLKTQVAVKIGDKTITKSVAAWVYRRRELAILDRKAWAHCTNRNLQVTIDRRDNDKVYPVILNYDPQTRDKKVEEYSTEPSLIDSRLETVNATTDLLELTE